MRLLLITAAVSTALSCSAAAAPRFRDQFRVWVSSGFSTGLYESLVLRRVESKDGPFWMAEWRTRTTAGVTGPTVKIERAWADGRQCAAVQSSVEEIAAIPPPNRGSIIPPFHGATVHLAARAPDGHYVVRSDYEGPITAWWAKTTAALKACAPPPICCVDGELLPLTLEEDSDEEPYRSMGAEGWAQRQRLMRRPGPAPPN